MSLSHIFLGFLLKVCYYTDTVTLTGNITDVYNRPIPSASITLSDSLNGNILAYAISNAKGEYKIEITSTLKEFVLQARAFNYATETRTIPNLSATYNFTLTPKPTELPNVLVKPPPIQKRGDTINYVVSAFADQKDRSITDVLSKINFSNESVNNMWKRIFWGGAKKHFKFVKEIFEENLHASKVGHL